MAAVEYQKKWSRHLLSRSNEIRDLGVSTLGLALDACKTLWPASIALALPSAIGGDWRGQHSPWFCARHIPRSSGWACCVSASCVTAPRHHLSDRVAGLRVWSLLGGSNGQASSPPPWLPAMPFLHGCETLGCGAGPGIRW